MNSSGKLAHNLLLSFAAFPSSSFAKKYFYNCGFSLEVCIRGTWWCCESTRIQALWVWLSESTRIQTPRVSGWSVLAWGREGGKAWASHLQTLIVSLETLLLPTGTHCYSQKEQKPKSCRSACISRIRFWHPPKLRLWFNSACWNHIMYFTTFQ